MSERVAVWSGRVKEGAEAQHAAHVQWLRSAEAGQVFSRYLLEEYRLVQRGARLEVTFKSKDPPAIIRFIRNRRMWPAFWQYEGAGSGPADEAEGGLPGELLVHWRRV